MGANSVTGVGPGESYGRYKREHNNGCGCKDVDISEPPPSRPVGCVVRTRTGPGVVKYKTGRSVSIKVC